jgi:hypothetical protein
MIKFINVKELMKIGKYLYKLDVNERRKLIRYNSE